MRWISDLYTLMAYFQWILLLTPSLIDFITYQNGLDELVLSFQIKPNNNASHLESYLYYPWEYNM